MVATPHPVTVGQVHLLSCCKYTIEVDDTLKHAHYFSASLTPPTSFPDSPLQDISEHPLSTVYVLSWLGHRLHSYCGGKMPQKAYMW